MLALVAVEVLFQDDEDEVGAGGGAIAGVGVGEGAGFGGAAVASAFVPGNQGFADVDYGHFDYAGAVCGGVFSAAARSSRPKPRFVEQGGR